MGALFGEAEARAVCSELARLSGEAASVVKDMNGIARCKDLNRFAMAWVVRHAREHRLSCRISGDAVVEIEGRYREALKMRYAVRAGRSLTPFPPEAR